MPLTSVYADPAQTTRNAALLAKRSGVTVAEAKSFLRDQASSQVRRRINKPTTFSPSGDLPGTYAADVIFLADYSSVNASRTCILTLQQINSRYVYGRSLTKPTSAKTGEALLDILEENTKDVEEKKNSSPILKLRTDNGGEFAGDFAKLLAKFGIPHDHAEAETHSRLARIDRFHRTLRMMIGELFAERGSHVWYDVLPQLIANFNSRPSRALGGLAPEDIGPDEEDAIREADLERAQTVRASTDESGIEPGTRVRLQYSKTKAGAKDKFSKSHEVSWTPEIYEVVRPVGPNSFLIDVPPGEIKVWPLHSLQIVKKSLGERKEGPVVDKKVVRVQRLERRNISLEENKEALEAPARPRRERAPRVDYKKLAAGT